MKSRGTAWAGFFSLVFAAGFGIFLVIVLTGVWTHDGGKHAVGGVIFCGVIALGAFGVSRLEDDEDRLNERERVAREAYEKELADIERRRKRLP